MRIFKKTKKQNGRRHIYLCGIKIFSYKKEKNGQLYLCNVSGKNNSIMIIKNGKQKTFSYADIPGLSLNISGNNNKIVLHFPINFKNTEIKILNDNCLVEIGTSKWIWNTQIHCSRGIGQKCIIGDNTTINGCQIILTDETACTIGKNCMLYKRQHA